MQGVRDAAPEAIAALPGFSLASARKLLDALARSNPVSGGEAVQPAIASDVQDVDLVVPDAAGRTLPTADPSRSPALPES